MFLFLHHSASNRMASSIGLAFATYTSLDIFCPNFDRMALPNLLAGARLFSLIAQAIYLHNECYEALLKIVFGKGCQNLALDFILAQVQQTGID